jgi:hypothetical protein
MDNADVQVTIGTGDDAETVSLLDIAGVDMSQVEANYGFVVTPAGTFHLKCKDAKFEPMEVTDKDTQQKIKKLTVAFDFDILTVLSLQDKSKDPTTLVGDVHQERFWITDAYKDIGRVRALLEESGLQMSGTLQQLLDAYVGHEIITVITNRTDKNDSDRKYANIDLKKTKPAQLGAQAMPVQPQTEAVQTPANAPTGTTPAKPAAFKFGR